MNVDELLSSILRGAALLLGCNSANLIVYHADQKEVAVRIGVSEDEQELIRNIESMFGSGFKLRAFAVESIQGSLALQALRMGELRETGCLSELVGDVFPKDVVSAVAELIGPHRFILVPVLHCGRTYGLIVFEKGGTEPFSVQQRAVMLRYAERIGELLENEVRALGTTLPHDSSGRVEAELLLDAAGVVVGRAVSNERQEPQALPTDLLAQLKTQAAIIASPDNELNEHRFEWPAAPTPGVPWEAQLQRMTLGDETLVRARLIYGGREQSPPVTRQLLHLALGETAPALLVCPRYRITSCNTATERLLGYRAAEIIDRPVGELFRDPREIQSILNQQFLFLTDGYHEEDVIVRHQSGHVLPCTLRALLLADDSRDALGFLVMLWDRSDAPAAGAGVGHVMRKERLATMGELAAQLAHEIRNPLLAIGASLNSLDSDRRETREAQNEPESEQDRVLGLLADEITRLDLILKDYMSLAVRYDATTAPTEVAHLIDNAARVLAGSLRRGGKRIERDLPSTMTVSGDNEGLKQVFFNLLQNAIEASPPSGVVECRAEVDTHYVTVHIEDRGPGLPARGNLCFEPFWTTKPHGSGLGLTVAQRIVTAHGGTISLRMRSGGGCRASVTLPSSPPPLHSPTGSTKGDKS